MARDNKEHVIIIVTWDIDTDGEQAMMQYQVQNPSDIGKPRNYFLRGLEGCRNYFMKDEMIVDLQHNIPYIYCPVA